MTPEQLAQMLTGTSRVSQAVRGARTLAELAKKIAAANTQGLGPGGNTGGGGGGSISAGGAAPVSTLAGLPQTPLLKELISKGLIKEGMAPEQALAIMQFAQMGQNAGVDIKELLAQIEGDYTRYTGDITTAGTDWMKQLYGSAYDPNDPNAAMFAKDPLFSQYAGGMAGLQETSDLNEANDLATVRKYGESEQDYANSMMTGLATGTIPIGAAATGGGGGGGGGRGGGRHYGGGGGGGSDGGDNALGYGDPKTVAKVQEALKTVMNVDTDAYWPGMYDELVNNLPEGPFKDRIQSIWNTSGQKPVSFLNALEQEQLAVDADVSQYGEQDINNQDWRMTSARPMLTDIENRLAQAGYEFGSNPDMPGQAYSYRTVDQEGNPVFGVDTGAMTRTPEQQQQLTQDLDFMNQAFQGTTTTDPGDVANLVNMLGMMQQKMTDAGYGPQNIPSPSSAGANALATAAQNALSNGGVGGEGESAANPVDSITDILSNLGPNNNNPAATYSFPQTVFETASQPLPGPNNQWSVPQWDASLIEDAIADVPGPARADARRQLQQNIAQQQQQIQERNELNQLSNYTEQQATNMQTPPSSPPASEAAATLPVMTRPGDYQTQEAQQAANNPYPNWITSPYGGTLNNANQLMQQYVDAQKALQDPLRAAVLPGNNQRSTSLPTFGETMSGNWRDRLTDRNKFWQQAAIEMAMSPPSDQPSPTISNWDTEMENIRNPYDITAATNEYLAGREGNFAPLPNEGSPTVTAGGAGGGSGDWSLPSGNNTIMNALMNAGQTYGSGYSATNPNAGMALAAMSRVLNPIQQSMNIARAFNAPQPQEQQAPEPPQEPLPQFAPEGATDEDRLQGIAGVADFIKSIGYNPEDLPGQLQAAGRPIATRDQILQDVRGRVLYDPETGLPPENVMNLLQGQSAIQANQFLASQGLDDPEERATWFSTPENRGQFYRPQGMTEEDYRNKLLMQQMLPILTNRLNESYNPQTGHPVVSHINMSDTLSQLAQLSSEMKSYTPEAAAQTTLNLDNPDVIEGDVLPQQQNFNFLDEDTSYSGSGDFGLGPYGLKGLNMGNLMRQATQRLANPPAVQGAQRVAQAAQGARRLGNIARRQSQINPQALAGIAKIASVLRRFK